jgi:plasmid stabilization system protein ParE
MVGFQANHADLSFRNYIIYFREIPRGVEVMRVLHGARDAKRIFG